MTQHYPRKEEQVENEGTAEMEEPRESSMVLGHDHQEQDVGDSFDLSKTEIELLSLQYTQEGVVFDDDEATNHDDEPMQDVRESDGKSFFSDENNDYEQELLRIWPKSSAAPDLQSSPSQDHDPESVKENTVVPYLNKVGPHEQQKPIDSDHPTTCIEAEANLTSFKWDRLGIL